MTDTPTTRKKPKSNESEPKDKKQKGPPWLVFALFLVISLAILGLYGWSVKSAALVFIELLIAAAAISTGGFLGFLFGIPRGRDDRGNPEGVATDDESTGYRPSNSLEQISEWLTKILIGVGLVELTKLRGLMSAAGASVAASMQTPPPGTSVVTQVVIVAYLTFGFLASFLWTRLSYGPLQAISDMTLVGQLRAQLRLSNRELSEEKEDKNQVQSLADGMATGEIATAAKKSATGEEIKVSEQTSDEASQWPSDVRDYLAKFIAAQVDWNEDTIAEIFKKRSPMQEEHGKRIEADFVRQLGRSVVINLRVRTTNGGPLKGPVTFLLHPSFKPRIVRVDPIGDKAETKIAAAEWFTVVAILDQGTTVLAYNLKDVPDVPEWFKLTTEG